MRLVLVQRLKRTGTGIFQLSPSFTCVILVLKLLFRITTG